MQLVVDATIRSYVLKKVLKGSKFEHIERAVRLTRDHVVKVGGFFIVGLPESNFERDLRSIEWATTHLDKAQFWMSIPYYGTRLQESMRLAMLQLQNPAHLGW
jgi:radical SAM superfamily enzyme YgiQ (UPF0313 family)